MFAVMFRQSPLLIFPLIGLATFVTLFAAIVLRVLRSRADSFDSVASIPFEDNETTKNPSAQGAT